MNLQNTRRETLAPADTAKQRNTKAYGLFALGIVPLYTLLFACQGDLMEMSLSRLGNRPGHHGRFILWGIVCVTALFVLFRRTFEMAGYDGWLGRGLLYTACTSFLVCVLLPFVPDQYPRAAKWHDSLAFLAAILTVLVSLILTLHLRKVDPRLCRIALLQWTVNVCVCAFLLKTTGVSSLLEALYIIFTSVHTYGVMARLDKANPVPVAA